MTSIGTCRISLSAFGREFVITSRSFHFCFTATAHRTELERYDDFHRLAAGAVLSRMPAVLAAPALTPVALPVLLVVGPAGVETADPHIETRPLACL